MQAVPGYPPMTRGYDGRPAQFVGPNGPISMPPPLGGMPMMGMAPNSMSPVPGLPGHGQFFSPPMMMNPNDQHLRHPADNQASPQNIRGGGPPRMAYGVPNNFVRAPTIATVVPPLPQVNITKKKKIQILLVYLSISYIDNIISEI